MTQITALKELAEKVESATMTFGDLPDHLDRSWKNIIDAYGGSLDAAKALHEAVLPGWDARLYLMSDDVWVYTPMRNGPPGAECEASIPNNMARAWLLCIIRAKISELEAEA